VVQDLLGNPLAAGQLIGPVTIRRMNPVDPPGLPVHFDRIDTEILSMSLTGGGLTLLAGAGLGSGFPGLPPSPGVIVEQPANPPLADSFFDVFFEIQGAPTGPLRNSNTMPARMSAVIDRVPPVNIPYFLIHPPISLFSIGLDNQWYTGDDVLQARLVNATHTITPEPASVLLLGAGLAGLGRYGQFLRSKAGDAAFPRS
jgi:hypothetical protein